MPEVPGVTKDHRKQRAETHLRRRGLLVCVVGSWVHMPQALRGRGLRGKECALHPGRLSITQPPMTLPPTRLSYPLCAQVKKWLTCPLANAEVSVKIMYTGWQRILKGERKNSILFRLWHHSHIRYRIRSSFCALFVAMNPCSTGAPVHSIRPMLEWALGAGGKLGGDQAPYISDNLREVRAGKVRRRRNCVLFGIKMQSSMNLGLSHSNQVIFFWGTSG